jgi:serine/threonine-protein kinase
VQDAKVPQLLGARREAVAQLLDAAGLELGAVTSREDAEKPAGTVLTQQPGAGSLVKPGTRVSIVLATAPTTPEPQQPASQKLDMPRFIGMPAATARTRIAESGLQVARWLKRPVADPGQVDKVVWQRPAAGMAIEKGAGVEIAIGVPPPSSQPAMPAMVGLSMQDALSALEQAGLKLGRRTGKASPREPGTILRQSIAAGTHVAPGSTVDLVYAARQTNQPVQPRDSSNY